MLHRVLLQPRAKGRYSFPRPQVRLIIHARNQRVDAPFIVDTGSAFCEMRADLAERLGIPFDRSNSVKNLRSADGREMNGWLGEIRLQMPPELESAIHTWPCVFLEPPPRPSTQAPHPPVRKSKTVEEWQEAFEAFSEGRPFRITGVLGRCGFLAQYSVLIDDGHLTIFPNGSFATACRSLLPPNWIRRILQSVRNLLSKNGR